MVLFPSSTIHYRYAILGTGALGGFYGARLQQAGAEVHFLLRSDYEQVRSHILNATTSEMMADTHARNLSEQLMWGSGCWFGSPSGAGDWRIADEFVH